MSETFAITRRAFIAGLGSLLIASQIPVDLSTLPAEFSGTEDVIRQMVEQYRKISGKDRFALQSVRVNERLWLSYEAALTSGEKFVDTRCGYQNLCFKGMPVWVGNRRQCIDFLTWSPA